MARSYNLHKVDLGFSLFARRLLRESLTISFPPGTKIFQFPGFPSRQRRDDSASLQNRITPFGHHRIIAACQLLGDFRGLVRPSSAKQTKASTTYIESHISEINYF